jgi:hypothetical protein
MVKIKFNLERAVKAQSYSSTLPLTSGLDGGACFNAKLRLFYPQEKDPKPMIREAWWDWAIPAHFLFHKTDKTEFQSFFKR